jgi:transposase
MNTPRTAPRDWKEWRRLRALELQRQGWPQQHIAEALGVAKSSVSKWLAAARHGGQQALRARPAPGRPPSLSDAQKRWLPDCLWRGPQAYGFRGQVWTCARVAAVIEFEFGVRYHKGHVSRLLKELGWTPQVPLTRAVQQDEQAIERWRDDVWPTLKKRPAKSGGS